MVGELLELVSTICMIFDPPYKKRTAKENLVWIKQQEWYLSYKNEPKWEDMLNHDKKMQRILGSISNKKLLKDKKAQEQIKEDLVGHYEMWKIAWKLR